MIGALLTLALAASPEPDTGLVVDTGGASPLAADGFAFCHEEGADADQVAAWCALLEHAPAEACPGMRATCLKGDFRASPTGCEGLGGAWEPEGFAGAPEAASSPWRQVPGCELPEWTPPGLPPLETILSWAVALALALGLMVLVRVLVRRFGWLQAQAPRPVDPTAEEVAVLPVAGDDDLPTLPEEDLLAEAWRLLAEGRLGEAVVHARGAALRRLARRGLLRLHRARTDREYLRALQAAPEVGAPVAEILGAVEAHRWAHTVLDPARARSAVEAAARVLATGLVLLTLAFPGTAHAQRRHAPEGDAALFRLFDAAGFEVSASAGRLAEVSDDVDVVVLDLLALSLDAPAWDALVAWVGRGGLLVFGGDPGDRFPQLGRRGLYSGAEDTVGLAVWLRERGYLPPVWAHGPTYQWCEGQGIAIAGLAPAMPRLDPASRPGGVVDCEMPLVMQAVRQEDGWVIGISDARLLRNAALLVPANRRLLTGILREGEADGDWVLPETPVVWLATASAGQPPQSPFTGVANARLLPLVGHVMLLWLVLALAWGWPLAPLRSPVEEGRRDMLEHVRALGAQWSSVGATRSAASASAALLLARAGAPLLRARAREAGYDAVAAEALVRRAESLAADPSGPDDPSDPTTVEALWTLWRRSS